MLAEKEVAPVYWMKTCIIWPSLNTSDHQWPTLAISGEEEELILGKLEEKNCSIIIANHHKFLTEYHKTHNRKYGAK